MSLNLGATKIVQISQRLEELGREAKMQEALALLPELESAYSHTKAQLIPLSES